MNDHQIGSRLRQHILSDLQQGTARDGRRLQALVGDLCSESTLTLVPALRHLVVSPPFQAALMHSPPLPADRRLLLHLQQELDQVFTASICQRMTSVLRGLLGLTEAEVMATPAVAAPAAPQPAPPPPPPLGTVAAASALPPPQPWVAPAPVLPESLEERLAEAPMRSARPAGRGVVAVLSFMAGVLVVGVLGAMGWLLQISSRQPQPQLALPETLQRGGENPPQPPAEAAPSQPPPAPDLGGQQANPDLAIASVQQLYTDISSGNVDAARQLFSPEAADQFDPTFFSQFQQVSVSDLRETGRDGTTVTLNGVVTFVYPDGTSQTEARSFSVDTASQPALITGSSFGGVLKPRG